MSDAVLVLNAGSSSLKWSLFAGAGLTCEQSGAFTGVGEPGGPASHADALASCLEQLRGARPAVVGHRIVHGGTHFSGPAPLDAAAVAKVEELIPLAPLHNPPALAGVWAVAATLPGVPQVGVFDTAFHRTLPAEASTYALPRWCEERHGVRKYGFHGTSHQSAARRAAELLGKPPGEMNVVTLHLGNGCSAAAVAGGACVDTSMGFTPLAGLVMGTRSGDLDPAAVLHLQREAGLSVDEADRLLNRESGLRGLCGDNDVRRVLEREAAGDRDAALALAVYCRRIRKIVGAYFAVLGSVDAVVFTAGVGENGPAVRARVCDPLGGFGIALDADANAAAVGREARIDAGGPVAVLVVPAEEEREIARQARGVVGAPAVPTMTE